jgi:uncharacterized protein
MSKKAHAAVVVFDNADPAMQQAYEAARTTFRYLWRELAWERRRIVKAIDLAAVKVPFSDADAANVEHMWVSELDFDGELIHGTLLSSPNTLQSVQRGDAVQVAIADISDWIFAIAGQAYGAHSVNLMRQRMSERERKAHDDAWSLQFGDPHAVRLVYDARLAERGEGKPGFLRGLFAKKAPAEQLAPPSLDEHPMSVVMAEPLRQSLAENPDMLHARDDRGWQMLHHEALAGSTATVQVLLAAGADPQALTAKGMSARALAQSLDWRKVMALL